ncbi:MAG: hypothetical protein HFG40_03005 [Bacilli bacterium]|nr:hypothetical protein [Bacilli bacterium]
MSLNWDMLQELLIIAIACSTVTVAFIQKTKKFCKNNRFVTGYSFVVNMLFGFIFSRTFSDLSTIQSLWVGLFSFIGADTIYRNLEGKLTTYTELRAGKKQDQETVVDKTNSKNEDIIGEISRD